MVVSTIVLLDMSTNNIHHSDILIEEENWKCTGNLSSDFFREFIMRSGQSMPQRSYKHLVRWMKASVEERMPLAKELTSYINFTGFPLRALIDMADDSLFDSDAILELLKNKKNEEVALATLTPEERKFTFVITHNAIHEFEFCGLQWYVEHLTNIMIRALLRYIVHVGCLLVKFSKRS